MNRLAIVFLDAPNTMGAGTWALLAVVLAAILGGGVYLVVRYLKSRVPWMALPGTPALYYGHNHEPDTELLTQCLSKTLELLAKYTKWTYPAEAFKGLKIYVREFDWWVDETGRKVAGTQSGEIIAVGRNLASFLHECAHRCEEVIDRERDMEHATWATDGIRAAETEFHAWLGAEKSQGLD